MSSAGRRLRIQSDVASAYKPAELDFVPKAGNKIQGASQGEANPAHASGSGATRAPTGGQRYRPSLTFPGSAGQRCRAWEDYGTAPAGTRLRWGSNGFWLAGMRDGVLKWTHGPSFEDGGIRFRLWAPKEQQLSLVVEGGDPVPMAPAANGFFEMADGFKLLQAVAIHRDQN